MSKDSRLKRAGVSGYNKPKRTPGHPKKSHIVVAKEGDKIKTIRFGQQGKKVGTVSGTAGKPKKGESARMKAKRRSFKARHSNHMLLSNGTNTIGSLTTYLISKLIT